MQEMITINTTQTMSSLEIAEIMDKQHKHVMRDIKQLILDEAIDGSRFGLVTYKDKKGEFRPMFNLDFQATMTLITGYDAKRRAMVIDRWIKLETGQAATMAAALDLDIDRLTQELLSAKPLWAKIKRYKDLGLSHREIALLCRRDDSTIRKHIRRMERCGLVVPPKDLPQLQGMVRHFVACQGGAA